jgi:uncharacterized membrane protein YqhA
VYVVLVLVGQHDLLLVVVVVVVVVITTYGGWVDAVDRDGRQVDDE